MEYKIPKQPENSFRITLELGETHPCLQNALLDALKKQSENETLSQMSKTLLKKMFSEKKIFIKGQNAKPRSSVNIGTTFVDILL
jgi:hypothetical protein